MLLYKGQLKQYAATVSRYLLNYFATRIHYNILIAEARWNYSLTQCDIVIGNVVSS